MDSIKRFMVTMLVVWFFSPVAQASTVEVLLVFSADSGLNSSSKSALRSAYRLALKDVYDNQLGPGDSINLSYTVASMGYVSAGNTTLDGLNWMWAQNRIPSSALRNARDGSQNGGADLVLMVVPDSSDSMCGRAGKNPLNDDWVPHTVSTNNKDIFAFAVIVNNQNCGPYFTVVVPHEVGHLLYAEHEIGSSTTDSNGNRGLPDIRNHGTRKNSSQHSLMVAQVSAAMFPTLTGVSPFTDSSGLRDNRAFIMQRSFSVVSRYRQPAPGNCNIEFSLSYCQGDTAVGQLTATLGGYSVSLADYDTSLNGGVWTDIYEGILSCPALSVPFSGAVSLIGRGILETDFGTSECTVTIPVQLCGGQNPPWPNLPPGGF